MKKLSYLIIPLFIFACGSSDSNLETIQETTTTTVQDTTITTVPETTTTTVQDTTITIAVSISPFIDDEIIRVFPASDLPQETVDLTVQYTNEAVSYTHLRAHET